MPFEIEDYATYPTQIRKARDEQKKSAAGQQEMREGRWERFKKSKLVSYLYGKVAYLVTGVVNLFFPPPPLLPSPIYTPYLDDAAKLRLRSLKKNWYFKGYISCGTGIFHLSPEALLYLLNTVGIAYPPNKAWNQMPVHITSALRLIALDPVFGKGDWTGPERHDGEPIMPKYIWPLYITLWQEAKEAKMTRTPKIYQVFADEEAVEKANAMKHLILENGKRRDSEKQARRVAAAESELVVYY